jgi:hypothetical protein
MSGAEEDLFGLMPGSAPFLRKRLKHPPPLSEILHADDIRLAVLN